MRKESYGNASIEINYYEPDYQEKDALRDAELNSLGFTVMRFINDEVKMKKISIK